MKVAHRETQPSVWLEPPRGSKHHDAWRFQGILFWKDKFPMVKSSFVGGAFVPLNDVISFQNIRFIWQSNDFWRLERILLKGFEFPRQAAYAHVGSHY